MNRFIWGILLLCGVLEMRGQKDVFTYVVIDSVRHVEMCVGRDTSNIGTIIGISEYHHPAIPVDTKGCLVIPTRVTDKDGRTYVVTVLARAGLQGCKELTEVVLPDSCFGIGDQAMQGCSKLERVTFSAATRVIYAKAMSGCHALRRVTVLAKIPPECAENVFDEQTYQKATLVVPAESEEAYRRAPAWRRFKYRMTNYEL